MHDMERNDDDDDDDGMESPPKMRSLSKPQEEQMISSSSSSSESNDPLGIIKELELDDEWERLRQAFTDGAGEAELRRLKREMIARLQNKLSEQNYSNGLGCPFEDDDEIPDCLIPRTEDEARQMAMLQLQDRLTMKHSEELGKRFSQELNTAIDTIISSNRRGNKRLVKGQSDLKQLITQSSVKQGQNLNKNYELQCALAYSLTGKLPEEVVENFRTAQKEGHSAAGSAYPPANITCTTSSSMTISSLDEVPVLTNITKEESVGLDTVDNQSAVSEAIPDSKSSPGDKSVVKNSAAIEGSSSGSPPETSVPAKIIKSPEASIDKVSPRPSDESSGNGAASTVEISSAKPSKKVAAALRTDNLENRPKQVAKSKTDPIAPPKTSNKPAKVVTKPVLADSSNNQSNPSPKKKIESIVTSRTAGSNARQHKQLIRRPRENKAAALRAEANRKKVAEQKAKEQLEEMTKKREQQRKEKQKYTNQTWCSSFN